MKVWNKWSLVGQQGGNERPNACCNAKENIMVSFSQNDLVIEQCTVCWCRHFELSVDPGVFGVALKGLG